MILEAEVYGARPAGGARASLTRKRQLQMDATSSTAWADADAENGFVGSRAKRIWNFMGKRTEVDCAVEGWWDDDNLRYYLCRDLDDGSLHVLDATDTKAAVDRANVEAMAEGRRAAEADRGRAKRRREADLADAAAAAAAADAAIAAEDAAAWAFDCLCGVGAGVGNFDDGSDMLQCAVCFQWAHDECVQDFLRGAREAMKLSATRLGRYECHTCAPRRYRWTFRCACVQGGRTQVNHDDDEDMVQCATCPVWTHDACRPGRTPGDWTCAACRDSGPPDGKTTSAIFATKRPGCRVQVRRGCRDETIVREVVAGGAYERPSMGFEVVPGERWLDVGAHIGCFSALALSAGADVVAVEPDAENFKLLERNAQANIQVNPDDLGQFRAVRAAVVNDDELLRSVNACDEEVAAVGSPPRKKKMMTKLALHPSIPFRHSTVRATWPSSKWQCVLVDATTLPALLASAVFDGVKIDAQGAEVAAVDSVHDWGSVAKLVLEYDFEYSPSLAFFHTFIRRLRTHFPTIHHSKLKKSGNFVGFPNGVLVFAMREPTT